jgi:hypothetical protein
VIVNRSSVSLALSALWWLMLFLVGTAVTTDSGKVGMAVSLALIGVATLIPAVGAVNEGERRAWAAMSCSLGVLVGSIISVAGVIP